MILAEIIADLERLLMPNFKAKISSMGMHSYEDEDMRYELAWKLLSYPPACPMSVAHRELVNLGASGSGNSALNRALADVSPVIDRSQPMDADDLQSRFDKEGRLVNENSFRRDVFKGGCVSSIRREVWCFLFNLYPASATRNERSHILARKHNQYEALVSRWQQIIKQAYPHFDFQHVDSNIHSHTQHAGSCSSADCAQISGTSSRDVTPISTTQDMHRLEAKLVAQRVNPAAQLVEDWLHAIHKDVPRTDRSHPMFSENDGRGQLLLRDGLMAFCLLEPDIGYVQGMNDIYARFLIVFEMDPVAFWCFRFYVLSVEKDFLASSMMERILTLRRLLAVVDEYLHDYLYSIGAQDMLFCHRWLLLSFQREFCYDDGLKLMEVLGSHHLELNSVLGQQMREQLRQCQMLKNGDVLSSDQPESAFSFDLFVAAAILTLNRDLIFNCADASQVHQTVSGLSMKLDLDRVLLQAQKLFQVYCNICVTEAFVIV